VITDPELFSQRITIHQYYPNYISVSFKPIPSINVKLEYWVPSSHVIASRIKIKNTSQEVYSMQIEWAELLLPISGGTRMAVNEIGMTTILVGQTTDITPVLFLTGGAKAGTSPYPSLNLTYEFPPSSEQETRWVHASLMDINASYDLVKAVINQNWDAEFARIFRINSQQLDIQTGNKDWDTAFYLTQVIAYQLFLQSTPSCQSPSFVYTRNPDQGYSLLKDGSDYNHLWNGQTTFDAHYLINFILPTSPELLQGLLDNFLATQNKEGEIDWKPGLGGQRGQLLATPLLADITLQLFEYTGDIGYLKIVFPKLLKFFLSWFTKTHDRDEDFIPEWDQTVQTGFEDHPLFSHLYSWSSGIEISTVECPDLCSYLYRECMSLIQVAMYLNNNAAINLLEGYADKLKEMVEQTWSDQQACYLYRDRDSHMSTPAEYLGKLHGKGVMEIHRSFLQPIRPIIHIESKKENTRAIQIFIRGIGTSGAHRVDSISSNRISWHLGSGFVTSDYTYSSIEQIEVDGIQDEDNVVAQSVNLSYIDQSLLLPLWAGIPSQDRAKILVNLTIMNKKKFLSPFGIRLFINFPFSNDFPEVLSGINFPRTELIMEGMIQYGERKKAAEVFTRLMKPTVHSLKLEMAFHQSYHSETGQSLGPRNLLPGLIPIGLFLKIIGIKIINSNKLQVSGFNPFPWPVTIKFRGLTVVRQEKKTLVIFSDGQNITIDNESSEIHTIEKPKPE
jgi:hypothetical protein